MSTVDRLIAGAIQRRLQPLSLGLRLIANRLDAGQPLFQVLVVQIGKAGFDRVIETIEQCFRFRDAPVDFDKLFPAT